MKIESYFQPPDSLKKDKVFFQRNFQIQFKKLYQNSCNFLLKPKNHGFPGRSKEQVSHISVFSDFVPSRIADSLGSSFQFVYIVHDPLGKTVFFRHCAVFRFPEQMHVSAGQIYKRICSSGTGELRGVQQWAISGGSGGRFHVAQKLHSIGSLPKQRDPAHEGRTAGGFVHFLSDHAHSNRLKMVRHAELGKTSAFYRRRSSRQDSRLGMVYVSHCSFVAFSCRRIHSVLIGVSACSKASLQITNLKGPITFICHFENPLQPIYKYIELKRNLIGVQRANPLE